MPELPEVESLKRKLASLVVGKTIESIEVFHPKSFIGNTTLVVSSRVTAVERRAKILSISLAGPYTLLVHLKMTGQLIFRDANQSVGGGHPTADWTQDLPSTHTRVQVTFSDGSKLFFNDQRLFGWIKVVDDVQKEAEFAKYGPDFIDAQCTSEYLLKKYVRRSQAIKTVLLDNTIAAGVGNIYACEALHRAKIHPLRKASTLSKEEVDELYRTTMQCLERAIELGGTTTDGKYVDVAGFAGGYQNELQVYDRKNVPCSVCETPIEKIQVAGRGTYFCPFCQTIS